MSNRIVLHIEFLDYRRKPPEIEMRPEDKQALMKCVLDSLHDNPNLILAFPKDFTPKIVVSYPADDQSS